jgi:V/A-type H+-transporting ATPase subunit I
MLKPKPMKKVRIIVLKSVVEKLIKDLHKAGFVDIRESEYKELEEGRPLSSFDEISAQLLKLRSIINIMKSSLGDLTIQPKIMNGKEALEIVKELHIGEKIISLNAEATDISNDMKSLESKAMAIEKLLHFKDMDFSRLETRSLGSRVGEIPETKVSRLMEDLDKAEAESSVLKDPNSDTILILFEKNKESSVDAVLTDIGFNDIELPDELTKPSETINAVENEYEAKKARLEETKKELAVLSKENFEPIVSLLASLEIEAERSSISNKFSSSDRLFVVEGWIVEENYRKLKKIIDTHEGNAVLQDLKYSHEEMPPTVLDNKGATSPFEFLTKSYSLPNYYEIDPTIMYFIGLPIIYGMIVGDFLYGVVSIVLGYLLMKKFKDSYIMSNVSMIWMLCGFPTLIFGILFDEYGGMSHVGVLNHIFGWVNHIAGSTVFELLNPKNPLYHGFHRMDHILELVAISALIGMIHLAAGFILGAINDWKHSKKHALAKIAWLGVEVGMLLALVGAIGLVDSTFMFAGLAVLIVSVVGLGITEGIIGIIELPGLLGNILSYTRIAAIGIVGIVIAELLNDFIIPLPGQGLLALVFLPIFFCLHIVNAFIAMFESLVQGGRLNIIEFRSKFLHGGGEVFNPFMLKKI